MKYVCECVSGAAAAVCRAHSKYCVRRKSPAQWLIMRVYVDIYNIVLLHSQQYIYIYVKCLYIYIGRRRVDFRFFP